MAVQALHAERPNRLRRIFPVAFTVIAGICLTALAFSIVQGLEDERIELDFESIAVNQVRSLNERINTYEDSLHTLRSLFVASEHVSRTEFDLVCDELRVRQPGAHQFRWLPFVRHADRLAVERDARTEINSNWAITENTADIVGQPKPAETRPHYLPTLYISPPGGNSGELGVDQFQGPHQRALQRAIETTKIAATRRVPFEPRSGAEFGWIVFLAVYEKGASPSAVDDCWAKLQGVLQGEFYLNEPLLSGADLNQALDLVLTDETPGTTEPYLLNFSRGTLRTAPPPNAADLKHPMKVEYPMPNAGRLWKLYVQPNAKWIATKHTGFPFVVLGFGLWLTAFLAASIHSTRRQSEKVSRLVDTRTAQLREVEEQLRQDIHKRDEAEQRYQAFVQQSTEAIWRFEMDEPMPTNWPEERQLQYIHQHAYLAECNDACARMYGYDRFDEMVGMRLSDLMPLSDPKNREHLISYIRSGFQLAESESHEIDRFGKPHVFMNNATGIVENGRFVRGWGTQRDITEQRRIEKERLAAAERLRIAIEAVHFGLWEWDVASGMLTWNDELFEIHGLPREKFAPNYEGFLESIHPADRERVEQAVNRALSNPGEEYECEFRILRPDNTERWIHTRGHVRRDDNGKAIGMLGAAIDITARKESETERAMMERKLQDTQKLESLGILAGGIAHDFNNLLTGVLGNASLARMDLPDSSPVQPFLKQIEHSALRAADLCRQMLAYSGKGRFVVQRVNLSHLVEESMTLLQVSVSKDATLKMALTNPLPPVKADATQLRQILMNLVMNASDAIGERTGLIEIRTGVVEADAAYLASTHLSPILPAGPYVFLEVRDTGAGMDAETQKRIFDPFFTTKFTGRGLGLAAVLGIVRGHQGAMKVSSRPGHGSTFTLLLPKAEGEAENVAFPIFRPSSWRGYGRVLVIDDEETVRRVAMQMLKSMGLECVAATDGRQGVDLFAAHPDAFNVVLLDLTMPKMDGAETFVELRRLQADIPIILMSGYNEQDAVGKLGREDMAGFIQKPIHRDELQEILRRTIQPGERPARKG
jgi:PAS domain S-box-containing protein